MNSIDTLFFIKNPMNVSINYEKFNIHDSVHKTIGLSEIERKLIDTRAFQRLRNIKQLGLAYYVFPGADFSRFSHSIGVCHLSGRLYDAIHKKKRDDIINDDEKQEYRLAGLLHDIGHYPFSHTFEDAFPGSGDEDIDDIVDISGLKRKGKAEDGQTPQNEKKYINHESVGREIILNDPDIKGILDENGYKPLNIYQKFTRDGETLIPEMNMISSDMDADRLDYLLRSAHGAGLPYGSTDLEYIIRQIRIDSDENICVSPKALRTVDHFLLCRYFDYSQVIFHKTVAGFEEVLKKLIEYLISIEEITCSEEHVISMIENKQWQNFDDNWIMNKILYVSNLQSTPTHIKLMANSILERRPPKEIARLEKINKTNTDNITQFKADKADIKNQIDILSKNFNKDKELFFTWQNGIFSITKIGKYQEVTKITNSPKDTDKINQSARIFDSYTNKSKPIMERNDSLMSVLSDMGLFSTRLYVLFENDEDAKSIANKMKDEIRDNLQYRNWE